MDVQGRFLAVARARTRDGVVRLQSEQGHWFTEYAPHRRVSLHCLPATHLHFSLLVESRVTVKPFQTQRWVL